MLLSSIQLTIATYEHAAKNIYDPEDCGSPYKSIYYVWWSIEVTSIVDPIKANLGYSLLQSQIGSSYECLT